MRILAVNAGSSSLKLSRVGDDDEVLADEELHGESARSSNALTGALRGELGRADAVVHRLVHGGPDHASAALVDPALRAELEALTDLAPLHQPHSLEALNAVTNVLPGRPCVACFDTAFHRDMDPAASTYALPEDWRRRWNLRRYGFHGLSHAWTARRVSELLPPRPLRIVSCHLGAGASVCAIYDGRSVDTTMGFTPLDGLVMATRSGSIDPGLVLWLLEHTGIGEPALAHALEHESGLQALAGTADMREVLGGVEAGVPAAQLALAVYLRGVRAGIAAMAASLGGIDVLSFTGGVGERAAEIRDACAEGLAFLGVSIDPGLNRDARGDCDLSADGASVRLLRLRAREDLEMTRQARELLTGRASGAG
jgi:acetate kinase